MKTLNKVIIILVCALISILMGGSSIKADGSTKSLQELINEAHTGDTIVIPVGNYNGPIIIDKSLKLENRSEAEVIIRNTTSKPAVQITADNVSLVGLTIIDETVSKQSAILVQGNGVLLDQLQIRTGSFGIKMRKANNGEVRNTSIVWIGRIADRPVKLSDKGNGIDLYESNGNRFIGNSITAMHDGIYMENSDENVIESNTFELLRYGVHCMYTKGTIIRNNIGMLNITGAMIMAVRDVEVTDNQFTKQNENVNSQGILLFDAHQTVIRNNHVEGNRVGLYVEQSTQNKIEGNSVIGNFIGIQMLEADKNDLTGNQFVGNVANAEAKNSVDNVVAGNYWDSFQGIDADGDGNSDIKYAINPFFQSLIKARPGFQLFFQSPGMVFLESLYQSESKVWTTDESPLMEPSQELRFIAPSLTLVHTAWIGAILLCLAIYFIYLGVRRK